MQCWPSFRALFTPVKRTVEECEKFKLWGFFSWEIQWKANGWIKHFQEVSALSSKLPTPCLCPLHNAVSKPRLSCFPLFCHRPHWLSLVSRHHRLLPSSSFRDSLQLVCDGQYLRCEIIYGCLVVRATDTLCCCKAVAKLRKSELTWRFYLQPI